MIKTDNNNLKNLYSAAIATAIAEIATLPICTVKTNFQNTVGLKDKVSLAEVVRNIYQREGIRAFYRASAPAIFGQMFSTTSKYVLYQHLNSSESWPVRNRFLNGMTAGLISSLATHPMDVARVHLQMGQSMPARFKMYYRGYSKTFAKIAISSSLFFPLYDTFREHIRNPTLSAMASSIVATVLIHPVDFLKTRHMAGLSLYNGINPITYYRGIWLNLARIVPHFMITMTIIDAFNGSKL